MTVHLFKLDSHPNQIAVSKSDSFIDDGKFFLDFSRPIGKLRWFGVLNRWFGFTVCLLVPVVHQDQTLSELTIGIHRSDPRFAEMRAIWKAHYPSRKIPPTTEAGGIKIVADFAAQFPNDC